MMGWQWHQLDHMQIICTSLQTDNHASTSPLHFSQAGCPSCHPTNSVNTLKAKYYNAKQMQNIKQGLFDICLLNGPQLVLQRRCLHTAGVTAMSEMKQTECTNELICAQFTSRTTDVY